MSTQSDLRAILKNAREAAGVGLNELARRTFLNAGHLSNVENGRAGRRLDVTPELAAKYDDGLGLGGRLLERLMSSGEEGGQLRRRFVLGELGKLAALGVASPHLVAETIRVGLLTRFADGVDDWREIADEYGQRFMIDPPAVFLPRLSADLRVLQYATETVDSPAMRYAAPRLMALFGMATANVGDTVQAARVYRSARLAADRTQDPTIRQWVRGREAFRRGYEGASPAEVLTTSAGVEDIEAHLARAQAFARIGEGRQAVTALNAARRAHEAGDQSEATIYAMPPWRMALSSAYVYALMGDVKGCDGELALAVPPPHVKRWEIQHQMQRAVALTKSGDRRAGGHVARTIVHDMPAEQRSIVVTEMQREATSAPR